MREPSIWTGALYLVEEGWSCVREPLPFSALFVVCGWHPCLRWWLQVALSVRVWTGVCVWHQVQRLVFTVLVCSDVCIHSYISLLPRELFSLDRFFNMFLGGYTYMDGVTLLVTYMRKGKEQVQGHVSINFRMHMSSWCFQHKCQMNVYFGPNRSNPFNVQHGVDIQTFGCRDSGCQLLQCQ